jgi:hypothetical protein
MKLLSGFEVLTAVVIKNFVLWDISLCGPWRNIRRFGRTFRLHLHGLVTRETELNDETVIVLAEIRTERL